jgi:hypothetical protein
MQALLLCGLALYYAALAAGLSWWLKKNSPWFTGFMAIVIAQVLLYGGDYLYRGYFDTMHYITLITTTALCVPVVAVVVGLMHSRRSRSANAPT